MANPFQLEQIFLFKNIAGFKTTAKILGQIGFYFLSWQSVHKHTMPCLNIHRLPAHSTVT